MSKSKAENKFFIKAITAGTVTSIASSIVLLVLFSVFMMIQQMPSGGGFYVSFVIICLAALAGGFTATGIMKCRGMLTGALVGLCYILFIALVGGAAGFLVNVFGTFILKAILSVLSGCFGGVLRMNIRRR